MVCRIIIYLTFHGAPQTEMCVYQIVIPNRKVSLSYRFPIALFILLFSTSTLDLSAGAGDWCYSKAGCGPKTWPGLCGTGKSQSPINISPLRSKFYTEGNKLIFNTNYNIEKKFLLINDGHTVKVLLQRNETSKCYMRGDGLTNAPYYLAQMHFHWGPNNRLGSEHRVAGYSFPLELHMVHVQVKDKKSVAVLGVLFYLSLYDNPYLQPIIANLRRVRKATNLPVMVPSKFRINVTNLLPKRMRMFRYEGSLTTPPCTEKVIWTVFQEPVPVSGRQLAAFRTLKDHNGKRLMKNYRPIQPAITSKRKNVYFMRLMKGIL